MKKITCKFTSTCNMDLASASGIISSQLAHTIEIEFQKASVNEPVTSSYPYYENKDNSQSQEASMNYVTRIRNLREDSDKTQQEIAEILGTSQTMYARYERGANEMPVRHLIKLARYYNVSLDYLCGLTTQKRSYPAK